MGESRFIIPIKYVLYVDKDNLNTQYSLIYNQFCFVLALRLLTISKIFYLDIFFLGDFDSLLHCYVSEYDNSSYFIICTFIFLHLKCKKVWERVPISVVFSCLTNHLLWVDSCSSKRFLYPGTSESPLILEI